MTTYTVTVDPHIADWFTSTGHALAANGLRPDVTETDRPEAKQVHLSAEAVDYLQDECTESDDGHIDTAPDGSLRMWIGGEPYVLEPHAVGARNSELTAWLGDYADELTDDQRDRLEREAERINTRWPDPDDQFSRDAALSAAHQLIVGETSLREVREQLVATRMAEIAASAAAQQVAAMAVDDGMSEVQAADQAGIDRMTLRRMLGKLA